MFALFPADRHICAPRRPHSEPYKFLLHILKNNSTAETAPENSVLNKNIQLEQQGKQPNVQTYPVCKCNKITKAREG